MTIQPIQHINIKSIEQLKCPLTSKPFIRPWILLEDGYTYEKSAIEQWLNSNPNMSPKIGEIPSATLLPNCTVKKMETRCPLTNQPFEEPYYCIEDSHTYEKDAILVWFELMLKERLIEGKACIRSPVSDTVFNSLTLYPNRVLFNHNFDESTIPAPLKFDMTKIVGEGSKLQEVKCLYDEKIRGLIGQYILEKDLNQKNELKVQFDARRLELGLGVKESMYRDLDLSHLNLSKMDIKGLKQKVSNLKETDFSDSNLTDCIFEDANFIHCNMQRTTFANCTFFGGTTCFFESDMKGAIILENCSIEKGATEKIVKNWTDFKDELKARGAMNVDSISFRNIMKPL